MLYRWECWGLNQVQFNELRMLRLEVEATRLAKAQKVYIKASLEVLDVVKKKRRL